MTDDKTSASADAEARERLREALGGATRVVVETDHEYREVGKVVALDVQRVEFSIDETLAALAHETSASYGRQSDRPSGSGLAHDLVPYPKVGKFAEVRMVYCRRCGVTCIHRRQTTGMRTLRWPGYPDPMRYL
jgi:hypothetical protein